jgi:uncharacterized protein
MQIAVAYSEPAHQLWLRLEMPENSTVREAIDRSGILNVFPHIDLSQQKVGIFGKLTKLDATLNAGDRIEIYREIIADPKSVPRRRTGDDDDDE